jgi:hypothetical protein
MLLMWFTLPLADVQRSQNAKNSRTDFDLCAVAKKTRHCTTFTDVVFKSVDELLLAFHATDVRCKGFSTDKNLGAGFTTIDGRRVGENGVGCNGFITALHIESRKRRLATLLEDSTMRHPSVLNSRFGCLLAGLGVHRTEQRPHLITVGFLDLESARG